MLFRAAAECAALCVSEIFVDNKTMEIKGGLGSNVYPSVDEGVFAMTNRIVASVVKISDGAASVTRLAMDKEKVETGEGSQEEWQFDCGIVLFLRIA